MFKVISHEYPIDRQCEVRNVEITVNEYVISIGVAEAHYCSPRTDQGINPKRKRVEVGITHPDGSWVTRQVFRDVLGMELDEETAGWVNMNDLIKVMAFVEEK